MVPRIDPLYAAGRLVWYLCFPVAWVAARMPGRRGDPGDGAGGQSPTTTDGSRR
jgi:hypothetical protein